MKISISRLLTLLAIITFNNQALTIDNYANSLQDYTDSSTPNVYSNTQQFVATENVVVQQPVIETQLPADFGSKCLKWIKTGALGLTKVPAYQAVFGAIGMVNGTIRLVNTKLTKDSGSCNPKNIAAGVIGLASIWSGLNCFTSVLNFHENFTNLAHLISAIDFVARPSFLAKGIDAAAGDKKEAYSGIKNYLGAFETCAKFMAVAPMLVKTAPIFYKLITK